MVPEVGPVDLELAVVIHVEELVAERVLRQRTSGQKKRFSAKVGHFQSIARRTPM